MTAHFIRLFIATFVLLSALFSGALAEGFDCAAESGGNLAHQHTHFTSHGSHQGASGADEPDRSDDVLHETLGCHSAGSGCPGCLAPAGVTSVPPAGHRVAYALSDHFGRSIELADSFRPPIASL